jgi:peptidoglycan/xylan/chitin deacetylase (PgdA/CDA1 family)
MMGARDHHPLARLLTVMWHYVRDPHETPVVAAPGLDPAGFDRQLDLLAQHRTIVDWRAVAAALAGNERLPDDAALLTFDDGLRDHARTVTPRLAARGWRGVFFAMGRTPGEQLTVGHALHVLLGALGEDGLRAALGERLTTADADRLATAEQRERAGGFDDIDGLKRPLQRDLADTAEPILTALVERHVGPSGEVADALHLRLADMAALRGEGHTIGGHGKRHLWFDHEPAGRVRAEIEASAAFLADEPRPWAFAYPYGAASPDAPGRLASAGFMAAFHASPRVADSPFALGRIDADDPGFDDLVRGAGR